MGTLGRGLDDGGGAVRRGIRLTPDFRKPEKAGNRVSLPASKVNASLGFGPMKGLQSCKIIFYMVLGL